MEYYMNQVGERIRELRQKRGLTQKSLAGTHMTRNMLSLIENGQASPSLTTVLYLAERLNVPAGYFFAFTPEDEKWYFKMMVIPEIKQLYSTGQYTACELCIREIPQADMDDEITYISAHCFLQTALQFAASYALKSADDHLAKAADAVQNTIYAGNDLKLAVQYYRELIALLAATGNYSEKITDICNASSFISLDMLHYFAAIQSYIADPQSFLYRDCDLDSVHNRHLYALSMMVSNQFEEAVILLNELLEESGLPFYMRYRVCSDLEDAANAAGDFRSAYTAARKKLELVECAKT